MVPFTDISGMGTKLKCAINPLATSQNSSKLSFTVHFVDDYFRTRVVNENCQMERALEKQHMESIRKTMQMHENIFKHQVYMVKHYLAFVTIEDFDDQAYVSLHDFTSMHDLILQTNPSNVIAQTINHKHM